MKLQDNKLGTYRVTIPKHIIKHLDWDSNTDLTVRRSGKKVIVEVKED